MTLNLFLFYFYFMKKKKVFKEIGQVRMATLIRNSRDSRHRNHKYYRVGFLRIIDVPILIISNRFVIIIIFLKAGEISRG